MGLEHHGMPGGKGLKHSQTVCDLLASVMDKMLIKYICQLS